MFAVLSSEVTSETALEAFCIACIRKSVVVYHELTCYMFRVIYQYFDNKTNHLYLDSKNICLSRYLHNSTEYRSSYHGEMSYCY